MEYVGRPHDVTRGRIKEVMVNYFPPLHSAVESAIDALPYARFVIFESPGAEQVREMLDRKLKRLLRSGGAALYEEFAGKANNTRELLQFYEALISQKHLLELHNLAAGPQYELLCDFLEVAALYHQWNNRKVYEGRSAGQLKERFADRVDLVKVDYLISEFATDVFIPLAKDGEKILTPVRKYMGTGVIGQLKFDNRRQLADDIWAKLGYKQAEGPALDGLVGGQIVANGKAVFIGMNAYEEAMTYLDTDKIDMELCKITDGLKWHSYRDLHVPREMSIYDHLDVLAMPISDDSIMLASPSEAANILRKARLVTPQDEKLNKPYVQWFLRTRKQMEEQGYNIVPVPFWLTESRDGYLYMMTYCNNLQESDTIYVPKRSDNKNPRIAKIGRVLDDRAVDIMSKHKQVVQVSGFEDDRLWKDAGLRCMASVTHRE